jgi:hypothetical protein
MCLFPKAEEGGKNSALVGLSQRLWLPFDLIQNLPDFRCGHCRFLILL